MECEYRPDTRLVPHVHEDPYLTLSLAGTYEEHWQGGKYRFRPGGVMIRPPGTAHSNRFEAGGRCLVVRIPGDSAIGRNVSALTCVERGPIRVAANHLYAELRQPDSASSLVVEGLLLQTVGLVERRHGKRESTVRPDWLASAHERLCDTFLDDITIAALAESAGVSPDHFIRRFKQAYGQSPGRWVRERRLQWAANRLRTTRDPISSIGLRAGFSDQSHFTRAFKAYHGVPPGRYRSISRDSTVG